MALEDEPADTRDWLAPIEDALNWTARLALASLLVLMIVQVCTRYLLNNPLGDVVTITETYLMPAIVFFSLAALQRQHGHIRVDLVYDRFHGRTKIVADALIALIGLAYWLVLLWAAARETLFTWEMGYEIGRDFPIPLATALVIVPIGALAIVLRLVVQLIGTRSRPVDPLAQPSTL